MACLVLWLDKETANVEKKRKDTNAVVLKRRVWLRAAKKIAVRGDHYNEEGESVDKKRDRV